MKRFFDILLAVTLIILFLWLIILIAISIKSTSRGPVIYWSSRVGINNRIFKMPKFRSMNIDTPDIATHLMSDPKAYLSPLGDWAHIL